MIRSLYWTPDLQQLERVSVSIYWTLQGSSIKIGMKMWTSYQTTQKSTLAIYYIFWFRTRNYLLSSSLSVAMKTSLHKGRSIHLNVYTVSLSTNNGYSPLPVSYASEPELDGIVIRFTTLPGGSSTERQGGTLVHECGHWLGLLHTFDGGCIGTGDGVDDTPPEASEARGCPIGRKSCPNSDLPDPIRKYMAFCLLTLCDLSSF